MLPKSIVDEIPVAKWFNGVKTENSNMLKYNSNMLKYYDDMLDNYCIPITEYTEEIEAEVKEFLKKHTDYFLMYLSENDGYMENMWCITNWLE